MTLVKKEKICFVMPAYNEAENIERVVKAWYPVIEEINKEHEAVLMIANDGSKDSTWETMLRMKKDYPYMIPINKQNSGHGATLMFLYKTAIREGADYIFQTDSDGQTDPADFRTFYERRHDYDFQIGVRANREDGMGRVFVTQVLKFVVWIIFRVWVKDANTPFRLMKGTRLKEVIKKIPDDFFLCNVAISAIAVKWNEKMNWSPIIFRPRQGGVNSINWKRIIRIGIQSLHDLPVICHNLKKNV